MAGLGAERPTLIRVSNGGAELQDLGSKNGTFHAGARIASAALLTDGDKIRIGTIELVFRASSVSAPTATAT